MILPSPSLLGRSIDATSSNIQFCRYEKLGDLEEKILPGFVDGRGFVD